MTNIENDKYLIIIIIQHLAKLTKIFELTFAQIKQRQI